MSTLIVAFFEVLRFVVTMITPEAPRAPYRAADAASFRTVTDSISDWAMLERLEL